MKPIDYDPLYHQLEGSSFAPWIPDLKHLVDSNIYHSNNGHLESWLEVLNSLPPIEAASIELNDGLRISCELDSDFVSTQLRKLHPWRKGPIHLGKIQIDTEWRSDWKWDRLKDHITSLQGRTVLDIGCGNGYYLYRMLGAGAKLAIGIDPFLLFVMQFWAIKHVTPELPAWVLPMGWEDLPPQLPHFDTVFSMGVLYHRRNPEEFLQQLQNYVRPGGELVLETLVIDGTNGEVLVPEGRYAKMRNVWYIPSVPTLESALQQAGWHNVRCIDVSPTSIDEQRSTEWMHFESLKDFLDPMDPSKTIEGYPAPIRGVIIANKPE
jgi:tRNA (mo5U34)-methyltransferase